MRKTKTRRIIILLTICALLGIVYVFAHSRFNPLPQIADTLIKGEHLEFPEIKTSVSPVQTKIMTLLKQEYGANPSGTKYSQGSQEAWCADFVSWIYNEAGVPFVNPHSGSWRIPGTITLREYYQSMGKFHSSNSGYSPKIGDIMFYDNPSSFGQHTNIIIATNGDNVTTIGGNEPGGIRIVENHSPNKAGFIGFGEL